MEIRHKAAQQSADDPFEFVLSDETVDRVGDIVRADGWDLKAFKSNPIALFGHQHDKILGVWKNVRVEGKRLLGRLHLAAEGTSELVDTTRALLEQGILKAVSVGFQVVEYEPRKDSGWDIKKARLHEVSVVAVPANPSALAIAKAFAPSPEVVDQLFVRADTAAPEHLETHGRTAEQFETPRIDGRKALLERWNIL